MPPTDSLSLYLREIARYPVLTPDEERSLLLALAKGDDRAKEKLIKHNLRLVVSVAKKHHRYAGTLELIDLIQEGAFGLKTAIERFDLKYGKLSTYAVQWIRQKITRAIQNNGRTVRLPVHRHADIRVISKAASELSRQFKRNATFAEIAAAIDKPPAWVIGRLESIRPIDSLDRKLASHGHKGHEPEATLGSLVPVDGEQWKLAIALEQREQIEYLLGQLPSKHAVVMRLRYGLDDDNPKTLEMIGSVLGLTKERIRQIELIALQRLRAATTWDEHLKGSEERKAA